MFNCLYNNMHTPKFTPLIDWMWLVRDCMYEQLGRTFAVSAITPFIFLQKPTLIHVWYCICARRMQKSFNSGIIFNFISFNLRSLSWSWGDKQWVDKIGFEIESMQLTFNHMLPQRQPQTKKVRRNWKPLHKRYKKLKKWNITMKIRKSNWKSSDHTYIMFSHHKSALRTDSGVDGKQHSMRFSSGTFVHMVVWTSEKRHFVWE